MMRMRMTTMKMKINRRNKGMFKIKNRFSKKKYHKIITTIISRELISGKK